MKKKTIKRIILVCMITSVITSTATTCTLMLIDKKNNTEDEIVYYIPEEVEPEVVEEVTTEEEEPENYLYYGLTEDELNLVYAVVMQEGGSDYHSAEAVMSTIINRVNNPEKWSWAGDTIIEQIKYPQQYCYSLDDYWVKYLDGNVPDTVKWAVMSVLEFGPVHEYDCFRGYYIEGCEQIGDNWYFVG